MVPNRLASLAVAAVMSLALAACGSDDDSPLRTCDDVTCGENASCDPATLECVCDAGYTSVGGECIDSRMVPCSDAAPENASSVLKNVEVTWTEDGGWSTPARCAWTCDAGFGEHESAPGECLSHLEVHCDAGAVEPPDNASLIDDELVTIVWDDDEGWNEPRACDWSCDAGFGEHGSRPGECLDTVEVACDESATPQDATAETEAVLITFDEHAGWSDPEACSWTCDAGFAEHGSAPDECHDELTVACVDRSHENAEPTAETVTISWDGEAWSDDSCPWQCLPSFAEHGSVPGECHDELTVACVDRSHENAEPTAETVTISWDGEAWSDDSCPWRCLDEHHLEDGRCVQNAQIGWCNLQWPNPRELDGPLMVPVEREIEFFGQVWVSEKTGQAERLRGISSKLCFTPGRMTAPVDVDALECVPAVYNVAAGNDDEYTVRHAFLEPLDYEYLFAFSGDGGETWYACDLDGIVEDDVAPGAVAIVEPINADFEDWGEDGEGGQVPLNWDFGAGLIVERGEDHEEYGATVVLIRDTTDNGEAEVSSGLIPVEPDTLYLIMLFVHDNDPDGRVNTIYQWFDAAGEPLAASTYPNNHSQDDEHWQAVTRQVGAPSDAAFLRIATRLYAPKSEVYPGGQVTLGWMAAMAAGPAVVYEPCVDSPPEGAYTVDDTVIHALSWSDGDQAFPEAELCPWECVEGWEAGDDGCYKPTLAMWDFGVQGEETFETTAFAGDNEGRLLQVFGGPTFSQWTAGADGARAPNFNNWNGKAGSAYWHISFSTMGFADLELSSGQRSSNTGPRDFQIQYSLDGVEWHDLDGGEITVRNNWTDGDFDGALPAAMADQSLVHIRWLMTSETSANNGTVGSTGTNRLFNVAVSGAAIPL